MTKQEQNILSLCEKAKDAIEQLNETEIALKCEYESLPDNNPKLSRINRMLDSITAAKKVVNFRSSTRVYR